MDYVEKCDFKLDFDEWDWWFWFVLVKGTVCCSMLIVFMVLVENFHKQEFPRTFWTSLVHVVNLSNFYESDEREFSLICGAELNASDTPRANTCESGCCAVLPQDPVLSASSQCHPVKWPAPNSTAKRTGFVHYNVVAHDVTAFQ